MVVPVDGLAGALLTEEGWEVWSHWLEPPSWRGLGEAHGRPAALGPRPKA